MEEAARKPTADGRARFFDGLISYVRIPWMPQAAFSQLHRTPTWGWAALMGMLMTLLATLVAQPAQLHVLAVTEAHRIAALPPADQLRERVAVAQTAGLIHSFLLIGALVGPWIIWLLIAAFLFIGAAIGRGEARFPAAWVAALNSYVVLGIALVANALLVGLRNPTSLSSSLDLVRLPNPGMLVAHHHVLASFLSAYNPLYIWYYIIVAVALERLLGMPRAGAVVVAGVYSLLHGLLAALS
jgi:hypothetical protein